MIQYLTFCWNPFQVNSYLLYHENGEGWLIDAGMENEKELKQLENILREHHVDLTRILLTHGHVDHVCGCNYLYKKYNLSPELHPEDHFLYQHAAAQGEMFGLSIDVLPTPLALEPGQWELGGTTVHAIHLPGHSPGSLGFFLPEEKWCFAGDVLFKQGIGRTDLPGGDYQQLLDSIARKMLGTMGDDTIVFSGHGPATTIGSEKRNNPFLSENGL